MTDERFTDEERHLMILAGREAYKSIKTGDYVADKIVEAAIVRLTRPAIGPDVPVMYDMRDGGTDLLNTMRNVAQFSRAINIRGLIPAPMVMEIIDAALSNYVTPTMYECVRAEITEKLAAYTRGE